MHVGRRCPCATRRCRPSRCTARTFGSYPADEVAWLLTDLSGVALEAPTEEREEAIQSGGAHYAESLPIEYQPDAAYQQLFDDALAESADRSRTPSASVTELVLAERGPGVGAGLAGPGRHAGRRADAPLGAASRTASTCRTTR